jgi:hypothetical protein
MAPMAILAVTATGYGFSIQFVFDHASDRERNNNN